MPKLDLKKERKKKYDSKPIYNEKYLKAKIKSYNRKINTNFHNDKIPREGSPFVCLSVTFIDSVFRTAKNYYPQVFLDKCKLCCQRKKNPKYIIDDIEISSDPDRENSDENNSDRETSDEETPDIKNSNKNTSDEENSDEKR